MSATNINSQRIFVKRAQSRFIQIDEKCIDNMSLYAMAIYQRLRLLTDFKKDCDEVEISVASLAEQSKMSNRQAYKALNELENQHYVIQRLSYHHFRYGKINAYNVARDYNFFQPVQEITTTAPHAVVVDKCVQTLTTTAPYAVVTAPHAVLNIDHNNSHKNKNTKPVPVFSCSQEIKDFIESRATHRNIIVNQNLIDQVHYWISKDENTETIPKRVNFALTLISKKKWNIPQGWEGITSQSIKKKEEQQRQQKEDETKYDALIGDKLFIALENARTEDECKKGRQECESLFKMLNVSR